MTPINLASFYFPRKFQSDTSIMSANGDIDHQEMVQDTQEERSGSELYEVSLVATPTSGAPPEASSATALPVKPYNPTGNATSFKMNAVLDNDSDRQALVDNSSDSLSSDDEGDYIRPVPRRRRSVTFQSRWWFQEPAVRKNCCIVLGAWFLLFLGIACFFVGLILEIIYHVHSQDVIRGVIFMVISIIILIPTVYAVTHIYLAAKRVGRVRFNSVWFFR